MTTCNVSTRLSSVYSVHPRSKEGWKDEPLLPQLLLLLPQSYTLVLRQPPGPLLCQGLLLCLPGEGVGGGAVLLHCLPGVLPPASIWTQTKRTSHPLSTAWHLVTLFIRICNSTVPHGQELLSALPALHLHPDSFLKIWNINIFSHFLIETCLEIDKDNLRKSSSSNLFVLSKLSSDGVVQLLKNLQIFFSIYYLLMLHDNLLLDLLQFHHQSLLQCPF